MEKDIASNKKARVGILISDNIGFNTKKNITRDKEGHFIMIKRSIHQEEGRGIPAGLCVPFSPKSWVNGDELFTEIICTILTQSPAPSPRELSHAPFPCHTINLTTELQLINVEGMMELEGYQLVTTTVITVSGKNHQWMLI